MLQLSSHLFSSCPVLLQGRLCPSPRLPLPRMLLSQQGDLMLEGLVLSSSSIDDPLELPRFCLQGLVGDCQRRVAVVRGLMPYGVSVRDLIGSDAGVLSP